jgi:hypothetical protein
MVFSVTFQLEKDNAKKGVNYQIFVGFHLIQELFPKVSII